MCKAAFRHKTLPVIAAGLITLGLAVPLAWRALEQYQIFFGMYHDDGIYLVTGKALAEGRGYRIISLPGEPPETKYPIGFPLYLSLAWRMMPKFPDILPLLSALQVVLALSAAAAACAYLLRTRKVTPILALVILSACVLNYHYLDFSPMIMSDLPYSLLAFLGLWLTERLAGQPARRGAPGCAGVPPASGMARRCGAPARPLSAAALALLLAAAATVRSQGLVVILAALVYLAARGRLRLAAAIAVGCAVAIAPQFLWQHYAQAAIPAQLAFYTSYLGHSYGTLPGFSSLRQVIWSNYEWSGILQINTYYPFLARIPYRSLSPLAFELVYRLLYPLLGLPLLIGGLRELRRLSMPGLYCFFYALSLSFWPVRLEWRHIFPLLPLNYFLYLRGFRALARAMKPGGRLPRRLYGKLCAAAAIVFCASLVAGTVLDARENTGRYGLAAATHASLADPATQRIDMCETHSWVRANTSASDVFVCNNDPSFFLYTGRKAILPSPMELWRFIRLHLVDSDSLLEAIGFAHARYVVTEPTLRGTGLAVAQTAEAVRLLSARYPGALQPVFTSTHGLFRIFRVSPAGLPRPLSDGASGTSGACGSRGKCAPQGAASGTVR